MADIKKIIEAVEYCLTNGKCTECKFSKGRMFATCRYLMEDIFELLKEQPKIVRCEQCIYGDDFDCPAPLPTGYLCQKGHGQHTGDWFCADGKHKET